MFNKKNKRKPSLHFGPGDMSGWTPVGVSGYRALKSTAAIRELIQNGLDAADDAKVIPARMRFRVETCQTQEVPGIDIYLKAFREAQEVQRKLVGDKVPDNAAAIIKDISRCLNKETCEVLHVLDNGIGLNKERMEALLADGVSVKGPGAAGSYGNGHIVAFPASDLRYVLYGGLFLENQIHKMICSGHIILATRKGKKGERLSKDGYFVNKLRDDLFNPYDFPENKEIPPLIRSQLEWIKEEWQTGSVVSIVGFNQFRTSGTENTILKEIFRAASCNFFEAINRGHLVIEVEENENIEFLNKNTLERILEENKEQKRSSDTFLSGNRANEAFQVLKEGSRVAVQTKMGEVEIVVKYPVESGQTRIDLCRKGMWITGNLPRFQNQFGNFKPFHCVLPLLENAKLNRIIRKAEGPLHNGLSIDLLSPDQKKQLMDVLSAIRDRLYEIVPPLNKESFRPDDIFLVRTKGMARGGGKPGTTGTMTIVKRRRKSQSYEQQEEVDGGHEGTGVGEDSHSYNANRSGSFRRHGSQMQFQGLVVPTGPRSCKVSIVSGEKTQESEIRFALDESIDVTSDGVIKDLFVSINPDSLRVNGVPAREDQLRKDDKGNVLGVVLGGLSEKQESEVEMDYSVPNDLLVRDEQKVVLKVEMVRRAATVKRAGK